ncbi:MAG TPA: UDP-N-acetylmuramate--L-alanine ligase [Alphaproteobacteria bacterium]|nr:UDP-N-acetylmuramate--L-alanine ligase [Alphaproteobacteria bacterium]
MKLFDTALKDLGTWHFIGVAGIGMSGLAEVLARAGAKVQGSDLDPDYATRLKDAGVTLYKGHATENLANADRVVLSTAIKADNPELVEAQKRGLTIIHRADLLAEILKNYSSIAISGTHGKTSTTALVWAALKAAGVDVGIINGGVLNDLGTTAVLPQKTSGWLVVEADESDASFLKLKPTIAVITNIEPEHMDTYGSEVKLLEAFEKFADSADEAVLCADDPNTMLVAAHTEADVITYGLNDEADIYSDDFHPQGAQMAFDAYIRGGKLEDVVVNLPGVHYVSNALAALAVANVLKCDMTMAAQGLETFKGVGRRFQQVGTFDGAAIIDDYGHHPTEISTTIEAAKKVFGKGRVVAVIQPHRYTRLRDLMDEFANCAKAADKVILLPVHSAGEDPIAGVSSDELAKKMKPHPLVVGGEDELRMALEDLALGKNDAVLCLGAGSISGMAHHLGGK